jgi:hypothetical protein
MKYLYKNILISLVIVLFAYLVFSCDAEKTVEYISLDLGILQTNESGEIIGGDMSDWCLKSVVDTFSYVSSFTLTISHNTVAILRWVTTQEYHNYGFDIERKRYNENNYTKIDFVQGQGTNHDSTIYIYNDTVNNVYYYSYRLKMIDIYGNYKYITVGSSTFTSPHVAFFGPIYPNPAKGRFTIPFAITQNDYVSIYFIYNSDTVFITKSKPYQAGTYKIIYNYDTAKYHNIQCRLYIFNFSLQFNDSCRSYGDIQFN